MIRQPNLTQTQQDQFDRMALTGVLEPNVDRVLLEYIAARWLNEHKAKNDRRVVRTEEKRVARKRYDSLQSVGKAAAQKAVKRAWQSLLNQSFVLEDGTRVTWGLATVSEHRERVRFLEHKMDGMQNTIDLHLEAIREIESVGVQNLVDIVAVAA